MHELIRFHVQSVWCMTVIGALLGTCDGCSRQPNVAGIDTDIVVKGIFIRVKGVRREDNLPAGVSIEGKKLGAAGVARIISTKHDCVHVTLRIVHVTTGAETDFSTFGFQIVDSANDTFECSLVQDGITMDANGATSPIADLVFVIPEECKGPFKLIGPDDLSIELRRRD